MSNYMLSNYTFDRGRTSWCMWDAIALYGGPPAVASRAVREGMIVRCMHEEQPVVGLEPKRVFPIVTGTTLDCGDVEWKGRTAGPASYSEWLLEEDGPPLFRLDFGGPFTVVAGDFTVVLNVEGIADFADVWMYHEQLARFGMVRPDEDVREETIAGLQKVCYSLMEM